MARRRKRTGRRRAPGGVFWQMFRAWRRKRRRKHQAAVRAAKRTVVNQAKIQREARTTAGELRRKGFTWEEAGMPDKTIMEPVMGDKGWEYHPVAPRKPQTTRRRTNHANVCGAPTKDGSACQRLGECPIPSHKRHRKAS